MKHWVVNPLFLHRVCTLLCVLFHIFEWPFLSWIWSHEARKRRRSAVEGRVRASRWEHVVFSTEWICGMPLHLIVTESSSLLSLSINREQPQTLLAHEEWFPFKRIAKSNNSQSICWVWTNHFSTGWGSKSLKMPLLTWVRVFRWVYSAYSLFFSFSISFTVDVGCVLNNRIT